MADDSHQDLKKARAALVAAAPFIPQRRGNHFLRIVILRQSAAD